MMRAFQILYTPYTRKRRSIHIRDGTRKRDVSHERNNRRGRRVASSVGPGMQMMRRGPGAVFRVPARHPIRIPIYPGTEPSLAILVSTVQ